MNLAVSIFSGPDGGHFSFLQKKRRSRELSEKIQTSWIFILVSGVSAGLGAEQKATGYDFLCNRSSDFSGRRFRRVFLIMDFGFKE